MPWRFLTTQSNPLAGLLLTSGTPPFTRLSRHDFVIVKIRKRTNRTEWVLVSSPASCRARVRGYSTANRKSGAVDIATTRIGCAGRATTSGIVICRLRKQNLVLWPDGRGARARAAGGGGGGRY